MAEEEGEEVVEILVDLEEVAALEVVVVDLGEVLEEDLVEEALVAASRASSLENVFESLDGT